MNIPLVYPQQSSPPLLVSSLTKLNQQLVQFVSSYAIVQSPDNCIAFIVNLVGIRAAGLPHAEEHPQEVRGRGREGQSAWSSPSPRTWAETTVPKRSTGSL